MGSTFRALFMIFSNHHRPVFPSKLTAIANEAGETG